MIARFAVGIAVVCTATIGKAQSDTALPTPRENTYAQIGVLRMHYETYGQGSPLLLLHGGSNTIEGSFPKQLRFFSAHRSLIAPEQQGHGRTRDLDTPLSYVVMADNTAQLLDKLGLKNVDVLGWSDGGNVGLILAARRPDLVRRLVVTGANSLPLLESFGPSAVAEVEAWKPEADSEGRANYAKQSADSISHYAIFVAKLKDLWLHHPTAQELGPDVLARIKAPTLVIDGDHGSALPEHTIALFRSIKGAQLLIVPGTGHNTLGERPEWLNPIILDFLDRALVR